MVVVARTAATIELSDDEEQELRAVLRAPSASQQEAMRARIVLRAAEGATNTQIAAEVGVSLPDCWVVAAQLQRARVGWVADRAAAWASAGDR